MIYGRLMSEGRSFEQVDEMTVFDLAMIGEYRRSSPSAEQLLSLLAQWAGVYKPNVERVAEAPPPSSVPDPRSDIARAFAEAKFPRGSGIVPPGMLGATDV